jgi:MoaA/NifB/PqqE/SkfB family radical SAM enzyme
LETRPVQAAPRRRVRVLSGPRTLPVALRFTAGLLKRRVFERRRYPLLRLGPRTGFLKTLALLARIRNTQVVQIGRYYHFSLVEPRWPSTAYDEVIARGGLNLGAAGTTGKAQIGMAILGVGASCPYRCEHCYERANLDGNEGVPVERWRRLVAELQDTSVGVVVLSGGEPFERFDDVLDLVRTTNKARSDVHVHTTGHGASPERVAALVGAGLAGAGVALDHPEASRHDAFRGWPGAFDAATRALRLFAEAGIFAYVNCTLTRDLVRDSGLERLHALARGLGAGAIQLLEPKPCGAWAGADLEAVYGPEERATVREFFRASRRSARLAGGPVVYWPADAESPEKLGCLMGGLSHLYVDSHGHVEPCVFLPVSFGNVLEEPFAAIYQRMREAVPRPLHARCPSLQLAERVGFDPGRQPQLPVPYDAVRAEWRRLFG